MPYICAVPSSRWRWSTSSAEAKCERYKRNRDNPRSSFYGGVRNEESGNCAVKDKRIKGEKSSSLVAAQR
ncbi:hypothetical protein OUZ56_004941 [Daphnia magna]|uniref:Uncharacterized protein n=1 Tax=Daphnia magna TaxID=35525 RepID=A0ABQ9YRG7_9CRUS|nr:hypothetical protein OUZ56_004941 [Daphnia magna]